MAQRGEEDIMSITPAIMMTESVAMVADITSAQQTSLRCCLNSAVTPVKSERRPWTRPEIFRKARSPGIARIGKSNHQSGRRRVSPKTMVLGKKVSKPPPPGILM